MSSEPSHRRVTVTTTGTRNGRRVFRDRTVDLVRVQETPFVSAPGYPDQDRIFVRELVGPGMGRRTHVVPMLIVSGSIREAVA